MAGFGFGVLDEPAVPDVPAVERRGRGEEDDIGRFMGVRGVPNRPVRSAGRAEGADLFCFGLGVELGRRCWLLVPGFRRF